MEKDRATIMKKHNEFSNVFMGIGCFKGTFSLKLKDDAKPFQMPPRHVAYTLQVPFKKSYKDYKNSRYSHR